jgi:hypothetical protein
MSYEWESPGVRRDVRMKAAYTARFRLLCCVSYLLASIGGCTNAHTVDADGAPEPIDASADGASDAAVQRLDGGADGAIAPGDAGSFDGAVEPGDATIGADGSQRMLVRIAIGSTALSMARGTAQQLTATGIYSDNSTADLTSAASWSSSDMSKVTVAPGGLLRAIEAGAAIITAKSGAATGTLSVAVSAATLTSLAVTPSERTVAAGTSLQFVATGIFSDSSLQDLTATATWGSSLTAVATIDAKGSASGVAAGTALISASFAGLMGSTNLTVTSATLMSLTVTPATSSIARGSREKFAAIGTFSDQSTQDLTSQVSWASSQSAVAAVGSAAGSFGLATAIAPGTTTISASKGSVSGSAVLTVSAATLSSIAVSPANANLPVGAAQQYSAVGSYSDGSTQDLTAAVVWSSSSSAVIVLSNSAGSEGLSSGLAAGEATISAASGSVSGSTAVTVTPATLVSLAVTPALPTVSKGTTRQFTATGSYSDGSVRDLTTSVVWSSSVLTVAAISNAGGSEGLATGLTGGVSAISARLGAITASTSLTVSASSLASITITPVNPTVAKGTGQAFAAVGTYSDSTTQDLTSSVTWNSSDNAVATIGNGGAAAGQAMGVAAGQTLISATQGTVIGSTLLIVTPATLVSIRIAPANATIARGASQRFTAEGTFSDGSLQDVSSLVNWSSSRNSVASISNARPTRGVATAAGVGQTTISASRSGVMATTVLTVSDAGLLSIALTPSAPSIAQGTLVQLRAVATYTDGRSQDISESVTWTSSSSATALISNVSGAKGLATAVAPGMASIRASLGVVTGMSALTVTSATLDSIAVRPTAQNIRRGRTQQYSALGTFSDGSVQELTNQVVWSSSNVLVLIVSNTVGSQGLASAVQPGGSTIRASSPLGAVGMAAAVVVP